ncbi:4-coumarate--CoA ligase-like 7 [Dioscorea cayenensis subsp. rotundata]|uniref:4-coumarate--CoA ligase n=1 Tax=Dioscorea cayennensis subsp. rotundata TaxID=55577 RepID=A0AB40BDN7_DIOCR|nr:4-coumarate--CoA ligase-like 7 [Dioscorea cayenensis subsp. rotundata]
MAHSPPFINPRSGYSPATKTFHSLRSPVPLPPVSQPLSFTSYLVSLFPDRFPSHLAFINASTGDSLSYPDLVSQIHSLASSLHSNLGISKGHVAFILSPSCLEIPILYLSLLSLGAIITPANPAATPSELSRLIDISSPTHFFATSSSSSKLPNHVTPILIDSPLFRSFLESGHSSYSSDPIEIWQSDPAAILFSSGTTGRTKAAAVSHRNIIAVIAGTRAIRPSEKDTTLLLGPMFHSMGFFMVMNNIMRQETVVVVVPSPGPMSLTISLAAKYKISQMLAVPPLVIALTQSDEAMRLKSSPLRRVICGGAPLAPEVAKRFNALFPNVELSQGYGSTEAGLISAMIGPEECCRLGSVGKLNDKIEAKIMDLGTCQALSVGQQGELYVRGPAVMIGYVGDSEANTLAFDSEGWLKTGDICYFDEDGFLYIVDRLKEMIKYKAYQVAPVELEQILHILPDIVEAAVVPYPHAVAGQIPMAFVVRRPGSNINVDDIIEFVAKQVAPYKKIRKVAFIDAIPKTPSGKILRRELASLAASGSLSKL